jgi:hypothetical protein
MAALPTHPERRRPQDLLGLLPRGSPLKRHLTVPAMAA